MLDLKKAYYYVICIIAFFVLMWGMVDLASSSLGIMNIQGAAITLSPEGEEPGQEAEQGEQFFDAYYQKKMLYDRFLDSLARIFISGLIFSYFRIRVHLLEKPKRG